MRPATRFVVPTRPPEGLHHVAPLDLSTTYRTPDPDQATASIEALAGGQAEAPNPVYTRLANPNVRDFETRMTALEDGCDSVAFASGMAALTALLLTTRERGGHIVAVPPLYGGTHHLLDSGLLDTEVTWAAPSRVRSAIRQDTALVLVETPANPTLSLVDIRALVDAAGSVPVAVDSTFATPVLQQPLAHGATYAVHSATKFIGGHGDAIGGVVTTSDGEAAGSLRRVRVATGAILHPLAAHLLVRGIKTLEVRVERAQANAKELVARLAGHPQVLQVFYPGMDPSTARLVETQMTGPGAILAVRLEGGPERADGFLRALRLMVPAVSLGCVDTLVQRPAALTHHVLQEGVRASAGIAEDLVRISVGLEDVDDLWDDLEQALATSREAADASARRGPATPSLVGTGSDRG